MLRIVLLTAITLCISTLSGCDKFQSDKQPAELKQVIELSPVQKLEFAEKCSKSGKVFFAQFRAENYPDDSLWDEPEFHYSAKLNTCLVYTRFVNSGKFPGASYIHDNQVIDIFANKVLLRGYFSRAAETQIETTMDLSDDVPNFTSTDFLKRK